MNKQRINYILDHLNMLNDLSEIRDVMHFDKEVDEKGTGIYFPQSSEKFEVKNVLWIDEIPVLFPMGAPDKFYSIENGSVVFEHDIIRSAFYLLSGEQEQDYDYSEPFNRYSWEKSIQKQLGITEKPIVNYYFDIIISGIKAYCELNGIAFKEKKIFQYPVLFMSHDVDRVCANSMARLKKYLKEFKPIFVSIPERDNPLFNNIINIRELFESKIQFSFKIFLDFVKIKKILDIIYFNEVDLLLKKKFNYV